MSRRVVTIYEQWNAWHGMKIGAGPLLDLATQRQRPHSNPSLMYIMFLSTQSTLYRRRKDIRYIIKQVSDRQNVGE